MKKSRLLATLIGFFLAATVAPSAYAAGEVNLLAMGDWGNNGPGQRAVAATLKTYIQSTGPHFDGMLLAGDNFYTKLTGTSDPQWQTMFEEMYDPDAMFKATDKLLAPGGYILHKIDLSDYGIFSGGGLHPLTFLAIPDVI